MTNIPAALTAKSDSDRMAQVVTNLLSNARNHGVIGKAVSVSLAAEAEDIVLSVSNTAAPIADATVVDMFDPFKPPPGRQRATPAGWDY